MMNTTNAGTMVQGQVMENNNATQPTAKDISDFMAILAKEKAPLSDTEFQTKLNAFMSERGKIVPQLNNQDCTYEYQSVSDLDLPNMDPIKKVQAIDLANKILQSEITIKERNNLGITVSNEEIECLMGMKKDYKALTGVNFISSIKTAEKGTVQKFYKNTVTGIKQGIVVIADTGIVITNTTEEVSNELVDGVVGLGVETIKFTGILTKGVISLGANSLRTIFGMVGELASK